MRKSILVLPLVLLVLTVLAQQPAKPRLITTEVPVQTLISNSNEFDQAMVEVRGRLLFAGRDYFLDPVFAIQDSAGNQVLVSAWAPLEIPPLPPDLPRPAQIPRTMRDYLGKSFLVQGVYSATDTSIMVSSAAEVQTVEADSGPAATASPSIRALPMGPPQPMDRGIAAQPLQNRPRGPARPLRVAPAEEP